MKIRTILLYMLLALQFISCKKFLDEKSDFRLSSPDTLEDLQAILDNINIMNTAVKLTNNGTDEYFVNKSDWDAMNRLNKDSYVWDANTNLEFPDDWNRLYRVIFYANTVLDNLERIDKTPNLRMWNKIKASGLFFRSYTFFQLLQLYCTQYVENTASIDLGIPLRLNSNFNLLPNRANVADCYRQVVSDLELCLQLFTEELQPTSPENKTRPGKAATYGLLARVYLQMGDYTHSLKYSDSCLRIYSALLDYNQISTTSSTPFPRFNEEVIFYTNTQDAVNTFGNIAKVDTVLFSMYENNDLRKQILFKPDGNGRHRFSGSYNGSLANLFNGIATDEIYLIRSESNARLGNLSEARNDLNTLLQKRWVTNAFTNITESDPILLLTIILNERRKELLNRGVRWSDLKRLNKDTQFSKTLKRVIGNIEYVLEPNDFKYALLIPQIVIDYSAIQQNKR